MIFSPLVVAASAVFALTAHAAPNKVPPGKALSHEIYKVFVSPDTWASQLDDLEQAVKAQGAHIVTDFVQKHPEGKLHVS